MQLSRRVLLPWCMWLIQITLESKMIFFGSPCWRPSQRCRLDMEICLCCNTLNVVFPSPPFRRWMSMKDSVPHLPHASTNYRGCTKSASLEPNSARIQQATQLASQLEAAFFHSIGKVTIENGTFVQHNHIIISESTALIKHSFINDGSLAGSDTKPNTTVSSIAVFNPCSNRD